MKSFFGSLIAVAGLMASGRGAETGLAQRFSSGPNEVQLLELYTSEGCSSCPPAERWFSTLAAGEGLWTTFVPVAFHVTYWDYLGWKDSYARPEFSARQRAYAAAWGVRTIYTPEFVRAGREWRREETVRQTRRDAGRLEVVRTATGITDVRYAPPDGFKDGNPTASVALLVMGRSSRVRAGENEGRELSHDFVVLDLNSRPLVRDERGLWAASFPAPVGGAVEARAPEKRALAVWVAAEGSPAPLQATGGWLQP